MLDDEDKVKMFSFFWSHKVKDWTEWKDNTRKILGQVLAKFHWT